MKPVMAQTQPGPVQAAIKHAHQAEKLSLEASDAHCGPSSGTAVQAKFVTPLDPVIETADGHRLPVVPVVEAQKFNEMKHRPDDHSAPTRRQQRESSTSSRNEARGRHAKAARDSHYSDDGNETHDSANATSTTHPLFPPLPLYGPSSWLRSFQCICFRCTSGVLSTAFLNLIVLGSAFTSIPLMCRHVWLRLTFRDPDAHRPFHEEEVRRRTRRKEAERDWARAKRYRRRSSTHRTKRDHRESPPGSSSSRETFLPTEGGPDPLVCDVGYYARRVGLDMEEYKVQTEDGFIITLWHLYNPAEHNPAPSSQHRPDTPEVFTDRFDNSVNNDSAHFNSKTLHKGSNRRYPVLLIHGLLQSAGAFCTNDDASLAFFLCKSGYDVWLGNNRCGFQPQHSLLSPSDPRMWSWNIRQMGVMDLPALVSRVLDETQFDKLALVAHSQGTAETFVALAKDQRPELGRKISVFCALAPVVYAGPLIGTMYFRFIRMLSPALFRVFFGIHSFIPLMMTMHAWLPGRLYGALGYRVFKFLFNWSDERWEKDLRNRMFQFAPVYVSAESMRWWLGRECFAKQKCILATREQGREEDEDDGDDEEIRPEEEKREEQQQQQHQRRGDEQQQSTEKSNIKRNRGGTAWYNEMAPPMALWVCGSDDLVDGRRLLRRFQRGREPHVQIVHAKVIEEYEHLDVLWAMDSIEKVGKEVREVIWRTVSDHDKEVRRVPVGCGADGSE